MGGFVNGMLTGSVMASAFINPIPFPAPQSSWFWIWRRGCVPRENPVFEELVAILRHKRPEHFRVVQQTAKNGPHNTFGIGHDGFYFWIVLPPAMNYR